MRRRRGSVIAVAGVLVVLASGGAAWSASTPSGPDPVVKEWPAWPYETRCGYGLPFDPVVACSGRAEAERGTRTSEVVLRRFLRKDPYNLVDSKRRWRRIAEDEDQAEFTHGSLSGDLAWLSFTREKGRWTFDGYSGDCSPTSFLGKKSVITWTLTEPASDPDALVRTIEVELGPGPCSSGRPWGPRARFFFKTWGHKLLVTSWVKPYSRPQFCQGVDEPSIKVILPQEMELRRLYDGSTYPPRPAIEPTR